MKKELFLLAVLFSSFGALAEDKIIVWGPTLATQPNGRTTLSFFYPALCTKQKCGFVKNGVYKIEIVRLSEEVVRPWSTPRRFPKTASIPVVLQDPSDLSYSLEYSVDISSHLRPETPSDRQIENFLVVKICSADATSHTLEVAYTTYKGRFSSDLK
ncbi:MAG: hypothetical protein AB7G93_01745 [Bdellovibrionales bacterium]